MTTKRDLIPRTDVMQIFRNYMRPLGWNVTHRGACTYGKYQIHIDRGHTEYRSFLKYGSTYVARAVHAETDIAGLVSKLREWNENLTILSVHRL